MRVKIEVQTNEKTFDCTVDPEDRRIGEGGMERMAGGWRDIVRIDTGCKLLRPFNWDEGRTSIGLVGLRLLFDHVF